MEGILIIAQSARFGMECISLVVREGIAAEDVMMGLKIMCSGCGFTAEGNKR